MMTVLLGNAAELALRDRRLGVGPRRVRGRPRRGVRRARSCGPPRARGRVPGPPRRGGGRPGSTRSPGSSATVTTRGALDGCVAPWRRGLRGRSARRCPDGVAARGRARGRTAPACFPRRPERALWEGRWGGRPDDLAALDESGIHGPAVEADRRTIRAGLAALEGRPGDALRPLPRGPARMARPRPGLGRGALRSRHGACSSTRRTRRSRPAAEAAREILVRLEAAPFIARLDAALAAFSR